MNPRLEIHPAIGRRGAAGERAGRWRRTRRPRTSLSHVGASVRLVRDAAVRRRRESRASTRDLGRDLRALPYKRR